MSILAESLLVLILVLLLKISGLQVIESMMTNFVEYLYATINQTNCVYIIKLALGTTHKLDLFSPDSSVMGDINVG